MIFGKETMYLMVYFYECNRAKFSLKKKKSKHVGTSNLINYIWSQILSRLILNSKMPKAQVL